MSARKPWKVPKPPAHLSDAERAVWKDLARDVEAARTLTAGSLTAFGTLVTMLALSRSPEAAAMAPTARVRLLQAVSTLLREFGLTPYGAAKVERAPEPPDPDLEEWD